MEYSSQRIFILRHSCVISLRLRHLLCVFSVILAVGISVVQGVDVSIHNNAPTEGVIDLDEDSPARKLGERASEKVDIQIVRGKGHILATRTNDVTFDDEEFAQESGSGSGDYAIREDIEERGTPSKRESTEQTSMEEGSLVLNIQEGGNEKTINKSVNENIVVLPQHDAIIDHTFADSDNDDNNDMVEEDVDVNYDLPGSSPVTSNHIINPATWAAWSDWFVAGTTSKVRVRTCQVEGQEVNEVACEGVRVQLRSCDDARKGRCGRIQNVNTRGDGECRGVYGNMAQDKFLKAAPPPPPPAPKLVPEDSTKPNPDDCHYSLYDTHRQKFVFTRWNLTELITKSKIKRWCDKNSLQYVVMTTPQDHCRRFYKDLCKVSKKCRSDKPSQEMGDFAEGCWRNLVYGDMLPSGLSNKDTAIYFICQRFAPMTTMGKFFGYKQTHFGTLYDTNMRSPVLSLNKITKLGDDTWPDTDYFIEHGLVESASEMLWMLRVPKKGMLTLKDLSRCHDDQSCELGLRQVLPEDYQDPRDTGYTPTHLMWPELMEPDPAPRLATFTLTNMAPLHTSLYQEWHATISKVRQYAIEQCGVPVILDSNLHHLGEFSSHRANKSAMYMASGILPSKDPVMTVGRDVHVPFLFWVAGCCVQHHIIPSSSSSNNNTSTDSPYMDWVDTYFNESVESKINITAFAVYVRNAPDSHVIPAPILQLEMLLQDIYKATPTNMEVSLFPGHDSVCSDLKNDVSNWFQQ